MNKTERIEVMTKANNLSKKENEGTLKEFVYTVSRKIKRGGKVQLVNGKWCDSFKDYKNQILMRIIISFDDIRA